MRLIDADELKKKATMRANCISPMVTEYRMCVTTRDIDDAQTIEAEPVKHGKWIEHRETIHWVYEDTAKCSSCGEEFILDEYDMDDIKMLFKYCPNCGAKMDLEG